MNENDTNKLDQPTQNPYELIREQLLKNKSVVFNENVVDALLLLKNIKEFEEKITGLSEKDLVKLYRKLSKDFVTYMGSEGQRIPVRNRLMMDFNYTMEQITSLENC